MHHQCPKTATRSLGLATPIAHDRRSLTGRRGRHTSHLVPVQMTDLQTVLYSDGLCYIKTVDQLRKNDISMYKYKLRYVAPVPVSAVHHVQRPCSRDVFRSDRHG